MTSGNSSTIELASRIHFLPRELKDNLLIHLDPITLAHTRTQDDIIWRKVSLKKEYQQLKLDNTGSHIFSETPLNYINAKYSTMHPLHVKTQELESVLDTNKSDHRKVQCFFKKATKGIEKDRVAYVKAIIGSNRCHRFILANSFYRTPRGWIALLESMVPTHPELVLWLLRSEPFLEDLKSSSYRLSSKDLFLKAIVNKPVLIDYILENEVIQNILLSDEHAYYRLYQLLKDSKKGLSIFVNNPALKKLIDTIYLDLKARNFEDIWFRKLLIENSETDQFLQKYPAFFKLLTCVDTQHLSKQCPRTFNLMQLKLRYPFKGLFKEYLVINFECMHLENQFKALKQLSQVDDWLKKQHLQSLTQFLQASVSFDDNQASSQAEFTQMAEHLKHLRVKPLLIKHEQFHIEYLLSEAHRELITNGQLTLTKLVKMSPEQFLKSANNTKKESCITPLFASLKLLPLAAVVQNYAKCAAKLKTLYAIYEALTKDAQSFLENQQLHTFIIFMQKTFAPKEWNLKELDTVHFGNLLSKTLRGMIQTNHISLAQACQLDLSELDKVHSIDAHLNGFFKATRKKLNSTPFDNQEQALRYLLECTPKLDDISLTLQTLLNIVTKLPSIVLKARSTQSPQTKFFSVQADVKYKVTRNIGQLTQANQLAISQVDSNCLTL